MHKYRYDVSLRIFHPTEHPQSFTNALCLEPKFIDVVGQPRIRKGKALDHISEETYWSHEFNTDTDQDVEEFISSTINNLEIFSAFFETLHNSGGRSEFFIGFFIEAQNCAIILSPELQRKCSALNIGLAFDIYGL